MQKHKDNFQTQNAAANYGGTLNLFLYIQGTTLTCRLFDSMYI